MNTDEVGTRWRVIKREAGWPDPANMWTVIYDRWWELDQNSDAASIEDGQFPSWEVAMEACEQAIRSAGPVLCSVWHHDPLRGIVDESCERPATGPDGLCDEHRVSRARNQQKRAASKVRRTRHILARARVSRWNR